MRVAFILGRFPVLSEAFILNQITGLIDRGHDVELYSLEGPSGETKMHPSVEKYGLLDRVYYAPQVPDHYIERVLKALQLLVFNFHRNPIVCLRALNVFKYGKGVASLRPLYAAIPTLDRPPYDIIHCQFGNYALEALMLCKLGALQGKLMSSFRGWDISWYLKEKGDRVYDELLITGDFFLTNCNFFRQRVIQLGCDEAKIVVHGSGIDCSKFTFKPRYPSSDGQIRVATTGRLIEKKGIEYGIRAIATVVQRYPNLEYNIIGDGYLKEYFEQLIQELGVAHCVKLLGWRQQQEIIDVLDQSHVFIAPSVTAADGNQDAPVNTLKEAMAMGLPVIATTHGGIPELVQDGISGFLVPERDAEAIARKLIDLIEHPECWVEMGKAGRSYVEAHYDMHQLNDELVEIYQRVLTGETMPQRSTPQAVMLASS
ncbi:glycosyltransferase [Oculatella sp. LEGE 06141]|uniref:glycosyltransferase n=1 Tax=Oculatella sp. LEGE 06141 TaxID=1828648 RepID=UPI00187FE67E|nr:glycosyltransferase [Oculatella sp. LEGE 06141]MBE9182508.1 glycosyltransferase [Oculatella sp. LEGE 06141]